MTIETVLQESNFSLEPTLKWVAVRDTRPEFRQVFGTTRIGKIIDGKFFVTVPALTADVELAVAALERRVVWSTSTSGDSGRLYPGIDTSGLADAALRGLVGEVAKAVERHLHG